MAQRQAHQYMLRSGVTVYAEQDKIIQQALSDLLQKAPAQFVLLTDVTGQVIAAKGQQAHMDLVALGSLVAGDLAASQEIARLTGQYEDYQMVLREGQQMHTFIVEAGLHLALLAQISHEVPLGWARMMVKKAAQQMAETMAEPPVDVLPSPAFEDDLFGAEDLADSFSVALDDLWME